jgi:hypothetical protein
MDTLAGDMSGSRLGPNNVIMAKDNSFVWFTTVPKHMPAKSEAAGVAVYEDQVMVHVQQPGDLNPVTREYRSGDERRWPEQWQAFQDGRKPAIDGTPLAILFPASPAMVKNLESAAIHTIESLANVTDSGLNNIPMGDTLRQKAKSFLEARDGAGGFNRLQAQLDKEREGNLSLKMQLDELKAQMAALAAQREADPSNGASVSPVQLTPELLEQIKAALTPEKRGPGRPPKQD